MSSTTRPKSVVLKYVEDGTLTKEQAATIFPADSKPPVDRLLDDPKGSCNRTKGASLRRGAVLDLVEEGSLSEAQAADILDISEDAIAETLE